MYSKQYDAQTYGTTTGSFTLATSRKVRERESRSRVSRGHSKLTKKDAQPGESSKPTDKPVPKPAAPQAKAKASPKPAAPTPAPKKEEITPRARQPSSGKVVSTASVFSRLCVSDAVLILEQAHHIRRARGDQTQGYGHGRRRGSHGDGSHDGHVGWPRS